MAVARRFAVGGYRVTLVARNTDSLVDLAGTLADAGARINIIAADASDPDGLARVVHAAVHGRQSSDLPVSRRRLGDAAGKASARSSTALPLPGADPRDLHGRRVRVR
jgi:NADP-dependent 3-hydroxy acid dehydrogenase YdfG